MVIKKPKKRQEKITAGLTFEQLMVIYFAVQGMFPDIPRAIRKFLRFVSEEAFEKARNFKKIENYLSCRFIVKEHRKKLFMRATQLANSINDWERIRENAEPGSRFEKLAEKKIFKLDSVRVKLIVKRPKNLERFITSREGRRMIRIGICHSRQSKKDFSKARRVKPGNLHNPLCF